MKYSGKTVSKRCATESVAEITIRRGPASRSMKGELAGALLTITRRPGTPRSIAAHSATSRSGSDQVELGVHAVEGAVTDQEQEQQVVRLELRSAVRDRAPQIHGRGGGGLLRRIAQRRHVRGVESEPLDQACDSALVQPLYCCA